MKHRAKGCARDGRAVVLALGFSPWKETFLRAFYQGQTVLFANKASDFHAAWQFFPAGQAKGIIWSFKDEELGLDQSVFPQGALSRMEDGFIRSIGRGIDHVPPWSLCLDQCGAYFDASRPSDLEVMCETFETEGWTEAQERASKHLMQVMLDLNISKYNLGDKASSPSAPSPQTGAVLVLGQVESDRSILCNQNVISKNADLLKQAVSDYPDCHIYFKQHPDCVGPRSRSGYVDLSAFPKVEAVPAEMSLPEACELVERVYTISSLGGFEALMRGKLVTTFGCPFYAGWGLTDDHVAFRRRTNRLSLAQLFHIAYLDYPTYFNPHTGERLTAQDVMSEFSKGNPNGP
nr:hypothetical protein [uncultured Cohaesibacter sp.]